MSRPSTLTMRVLTALLVAGTLAPTAADAQWRARREMREGAREVYREKREAVRELRNCSTRECARREINEGRREVGRERIEARREIRRGVRRDYYDSYFRGNGRWYRDGRYWDQNDYYRRYYYDDGNNVGDVVAGVAVGAAVVGIAAAIANSDDGY